MYSRTPHRIELRLEPLFGFFLFFVLLPYSLHSFLRTLLNKPLAWESLPQGLLLKNLTKYTSLRSQDLLVPEGEIVLDLEVKREKFSSVNRQNEQHEKRTRLESRTGMVCWSTMKENIMAGLKYYTRKRESVPSLQFIFTLPVRVSFLKTKFPYPEVTI